MYSLTTVLLVCEFVEKILIVRLPAPSESWEGYLYSLTIVLLVCEFVENFLIARLPSPSG